MCVMFVHVLYRSLKLLSTHLKCIRKQNIHIHDYKTCHPDVLNNLWQALFCNQLSTDQPPPLSLSTRYVKLLWGINVVQKSTVLMIVGV